MEKELTQDELATLCDIFCVEDEDLAVEIAEGHWNEHGVGTSFEAFCREFYC